MRWDKHHNILVRHPHDLTVAWAQRVVNLHDPNTSVSAIETLSVDIGTTTRVRLAVAHDGAATLARRWFIKLPSLNWRAWWITALPQLLQTEIRFYQEQAASVPVLCPTILAAQRQCGQGTTLVMADVAEHGALAGSSADALTAIQASAVIDQLALLHARFWQKTSPKQHWEDALGSALAVPLMRRGLKLAEDAVPATLLPAAMQYARQRRQAMHFLASGAHTLVHHDLHPGNLFWQQSQAGFLDWQLVRSGEGISDVAYFLATAIAPETRRAHERTLVERYQQQLAKEGVDADLSILWQRYRAHLVYPFEAMVVTLAVGGLMDLESNLELIRRAATAVEDHDAFAAMQI
ncbi:MAG: aminoglycoside phosphotransferase family protein [Methylophilaceae bacterium]